MCSRLLLHSCGWWTIVIIPSSTPRTLLWTNSAINFSKGVVTCAAVAAGHQKYILLLKFSNIEARTWLLTFYQRFGTFQWYPFVSQDAHWLSIKFILQHVQNIQRYPPASLSEDQGGANTKVLIGQSTHQDLRVIPPRIQSSRKEVHLNPSWFVHLRIEGRPKKHTKEIRILTYCLNTSSHFQLCA